MPLLAGSDLELPRDPQQPLQAATKQYVDTAFDARLLQSITNDFDIADPARPASAWQTNLLKNILEKEFPAYFPLELRMEVAPTTSSRTFALPIPATDIIGVDWGDGVIDAAVSHTYAAAGTYRISVQTQRTPVSSFTFYGKTGKDLLTKILKCSLDLSNITSFCSGSNGCFSNCTRLKEISGDLFSTAINATTFSYCFFGCTALSGIPENLFQFNTNARLFNSCFDNCTVLKTVPGGLFRYNIEATSFESCFQRNPAINLIPEDLFRYNVKAVYFTQCFRLCPALTNIPASIFQYNIAATNFKHCFSEDANITSSVPPLWTQFPTATGTGCFYLCSKIANLADVPAAWKSLT